MARSFLDHITVTAFSLEAGAAFVFETLGVSPQVGGEHPRMATHNLLLRLGDTAFLEVIAPNLPSPRLHDLAGLRLTASALSRRRASPRGWFALPISTPLLPPPPNLLGMLSP